MAQKGEILAMPDGKIIKAKDRADSIAQLMEANRDTMMKALPKHMTPDRLIRVAVTCIRKTPKLNQCSLQSLTGAIMESSQLGLELGHGLGHAWLVPYGEQAQFQIGYQGLVELTYRSGKTDYCEAVCVHMDDEFMVQRGTEPKIVHVPTDDPNRMIPPEMSEAIKVVKRVYAVAHLANGRVAFETMTVPEIEKVRERSKAGRSGPWITDWPEMAKKTVFRRLAKWLPKSAEMARAVSLDEAIDAGLEQAFDNPIDLKDVEVQVTGTKKAEPAKKEAKKKSPPPAKPKPAPKPEPKAVAKEDPEIDEEIVETEVEVVENGEQQGNLDDEWDDLLGTGG